MKATVLPAGCWLALLTAPGPVWGQKPTLAQLDSLSAYTLQGVDLVVREWGRTTRDGGCDTDMVLRRWEWPEGIGSTKSYERRAGLPPGSVHPVTWEVGWDDGDDEAWTGDFSPLDHTWTDIRAVPDHAFLTSQLLLSEVARGGEGLPGLYRAVEEMITGLEALYGERGLGEYPKVLPWRMVACRNRDGQA